MAKIKKSKLSWHPSETAQIAGYRLYWSADPNLSYDSDFIDLGLVTEVYLTDLLEEIPYTREPVWFGISAVDPDGNESDITTLDKPYQLAAPPAPVGFSFRFLDDFEVIEAAGDDATDEFDKLFEEDTRKSDSDQSTRQEEPQTRG